MMTFAAIIAGAYLAGSINFSIILFWLTGRSDPRKQFSGNPGATNVYRQAGAVWAVVVLLLDFSRAMGVAWLAMVLLPETRLPWVGLALVTGNRYPCFHGFKGGKGVANYLGFFAMPVGLPTLLALGAWVAAYGMFRLPFIGSFFLVLTLGGLVSHHLAYDAPALIGMSATVLFIICNHRQNVIDLTRKWKKE